MVTHNPELTAYGNRHAVMDRGCLREVVIDREVVVDRSAWKARR
jgi:hypothetical protein